MFCAFLCSMAPLVPAQTSTPVGQVVPFNVPTAGAPKKSIGPAAANTPQDHILSGALSARTRQTLQQAMNSARAADTAHPSPPPK